MGRKLLIVVFLSTLSILLLGQGVSGGNEGRLLINPGDTKWEPANAGSESITLREDGKTGATELLAHYSAGYAFPAHWHDANERIILIEGQLGVLVENIDDIEIKRDCKPILTTEPDSVS